MAIVNPLNKLLLAPYDVNPITGEANAPNPTQAKILKWYDNVKDRFSKNNLNTIPILYIQGGNGSGKTRGLLAVCQEALTSIPGVKVLWGRHDFKDLKLSVMDTFFTTFPSELITARNSQYHFYDVKQPGRTQSRIYFNGLKDLGGFGSQEFGIIIITEAHQISLQIFRTLKRRCRQRGIPCMILMESEPPNQSHWLNDLTDPKSGDYDLDVEK